MTLLIRMIVRIINAITWFFGLFSKKETVNTPQNVSIKNYKPATQAQEVERPNIRFRPPANNRKHTRGRKYQIVYMGYQPGRIGPVTRFIRHSSPNNQVI